MSDKKAVNHDLLFAKWKYHRISMAGQQRLQMSELQFDKFPTPSSSMNWKIRFKTSVRSCSDFPSDALLWIKEVEMVDSVYEKNPRDQLQVRIFRILNCWTRYLLIIQNSHFKKKVSLEDQKAQKEDRFLRGRQIAYMIYDYFRVTGAHDTVLDDANLFSITLGNDTVQDLDTRWDEILLSMTKVPSDVVLESLYKLRIRELDQLNTVLESYDVEIHQKISISNCQKMKTMVKRSMDQKLRLRNFDARKEKIETGAVVTNRRGSSRIERGEGICHQWKAIGQCSRGGQCSFRHDGDECAKSTQKDAPSSEHPSPGGRSASSKGASEARVRLGRPLDSRAKTS